MVLRSVSITMLFTITNTDTHQGISLFSYNSLFTVSEVTYNQLGFVISLVIPLNLLREGHYLFPLQCFKKWCFYLQFLTVVVRNNHQYLHAREAH